MDQTKANPDDIISGFSATDAAENMHVNGVTNETTTNDAQALPDNSEDRETALGEDILGPEDDDDDDDEELGKTTIGKKAEVTVGEAPRLGPKKKKKKKKPKSKRGLVDCHVTEYCV